MPAMGTSLASSTGEASDEIIKFYEDRAEGGCGLIITEVTRIDNETGVATPCQLCINNLKYIPRLEKLARAVHRHDSKIFLQLYHPGRENRSKFIGGKQIIGPSEIIIGIKATCGKDYPVCVRIDGDEFLPGGFGLEDAVKASNHLENIGVDAINISSGTYETVNTIIEPISYPQGWKRYLADPNWSIKAKNGKELDIRPCISCLISFSSTT